MTSEWETTLQALDQKAERRWTEKLNGFVDRATQQSKDQYSEWTNSLSALRADADQRVSGLQEEAKQKLDGITSGLQQEAKQNLDEFTSGLQKEAKQKLDGITSGLQEEAKQKLDGITSGLQKEAKQKLDSITSKINTVETETKQQWQSKLGEVDTNINQWNDELSKLKNTADGIRTDAKDATVSVSRAQTLVELAQERLSTLEKKINETNQTLGDAQTIQSQLGDFINGLPALQQKSAEADNLVQRASQLLSTLTSDQKYAGLQEELKQSRQILEKLQQARAEAKQVQSVLNEAKQLKGDLATVQNKALGILRQQKQRLGDANEVKALRDEWTAWKQQRENESKEATAIVLQKQETAIVPLSTRQDELENRIQSATQRLEDFKQSIIGRLGGASATWKDVWIQSRARRTVRGK
jgi:hypothetical protein